MPDPPRKSDFPDTRWSIILRATGQATPDATAALEDLCRAYWPPLYAFARRSGSSPHEAQDLVQGFLSRLLRRDDLAQVDPGRGRFRSYLLAGLRNYLVSESRRESARKRGGGEAPLSLNAEFAEEACQPALLAPLSPDQAFDRRWAETLLERALEALRREHEARGKSTLFAMLEPVLEGDPPASLRLLGARLGLTPGAVAVAIHRLRSRFRELVRQEVAQTVASPEELEEELRNLRAILAA